MSDATTKDLRQAYVDVMLRDRQKQRKAYAALDLFLKGEVDYLVFERTSSGTILVRKHPEVKVEVLR